MDILIDLIAELDWKAVLGTVLRILLVMMIAWVALAVIRRLLARVGERLVERGRQGDEPPSEQAKRIETLIRLVRQAIRILVWVAVTLVVLRELGVDIAPILAGAGIVGLAVGFGAQNLVRDVISGFFLILENQIRVGDVAVINGTGGLVEEINFRTTVLRDLSGVVHVFPNGTINSLSNMTHEWSAYVFDIGIAYKEQADRVIELLGEIAAELRADPEFGPLIIEDAEIFGVDKLGDSGVVIKGRLKTRPIRQWAVGREFLRRVKNSFDAHGIEIPFPHRSLYFGAASAPIAVRLASSDAPAGPDPGDAPS